MGAFYKNEDQTLYIKRDIGDSVALCQCVAQELGHAQLAMNCEAYSRRDMGFSAVCVGYMLCRKFGVDVKNFAIDRIPEELAGKSPKVTSNVATIEVQYLDPDTLPDTEVSETTYELLSDEDFNSEATNNTTTKLRR